MERSLQKAEYAVAERRKEEIEEEAKNAALMHAHRDHERAWYEEKLRLSKEVFSWAREFVRSGEYRKTSKLLNEGLVSKVEIYSGGWGHELPKYGDYGCWSRVYLEANGKLEYGAGYKWMGFTKRLHLDSPEKLARLLDYKYIKELHSSITSGRVWKHVGERLDRVAEFGI